MVLEAFASHQHVVLRDIPVYEGWVDDKSASFGHNVDEFVVALQDIIDGKVDKREEGYKVAESRSIDDVAQKLVEAYKEVLETLNALSDCLQIPIFHRYQVLRPVFAR